MSEPKDLDQFKASILLNGEAAQTFHRWSKFYGMAPATLIKHILTIVLRHELVEIPMAVLAPTEKIEPSPKDAQPYIDYTRAIAGLGQIDPLELQKLADNLGVDSTVLAKAINGGKKSADKI